MSDRVRRPLRVRLQIDGACRGNPGPAASAAVLYDAQGNVLAEVAQELGSATNNVAEYFGLIIGLEEALKLGAEEVVVESDSELLVRQCRGEYRVRNPRLKRLRGWSARLAEGFRRVTYRHIGRDENRRADALAGKLLQKKPRP